MKDTEPGSSAYTPAENSDIWSPELDDAHLGLLSVLLDCCLLFREDRVSLEKLRLPFHAQWLGTSLDRVLADLLRGGVVELIANDFLTVPESIRRKLVAFMEDRLLDRSFALPDGDVTFRRLMSAFPDFCQTEMRISLEADDPPGMWGGSAFRAASKRYLFLPRPGPPALLAHPEMFVLVLCPLPEGVARVAAPYFTNSPALRHCLALYDLDGGVKINLARAELFVHFERYLRQAHSLRIAPSPAFTISLSEGGLLNLNKG